MIRTRSAPFRACPRRRPTAAHRLPSPNPKYAWSVPPFVSCRPQLGQRPRAGDGRLIRSPGQGRVGAGSARQRRTTAGRVPGQSDPWEQNPARPTRPSESSTRNEHPDATSRADNSSTVCGPATIAASSASTKPSGSCNSTSLVPTDTTTRLSPSRSQPQSFKTILDISPLHQTLTSVRTLETGTDEVEMNLDVRPGQRPLAGGSAVNCRLPSPAKSHLNRWSVCCGDIYRFPRRQHRRPPLSAVDIWVGSQATDDNRPGSVHIRTHSARAETPGIETHDAAGVALPDTGRKHGRIPAPGPGRDPGRREDGRRGSTAAPRRAGGASGGRRTGRGLRRAR